MAFIRSPLPPSVGSGASRQGASGHPSPESSAPSTYMGKQIHVQVKCSRCNQWRGHTSAHPNWSKGLVCNRCADDLSNPATGFLPAHARGNTIEMGGFRLATCESEFWARTIARSLNLYRDVPNPEDTL